MFEVLRQMTAGMGASIKGLHSASFGRAMQEDQMSLIAITEWETLDDLRAVYGERWAAGSILPGAEESILETVVEHFESTLEELSELVQRRRTTS